MNEINAEAQAKIHEWTAEQVKSASKPNFGKLFVTAPNLLRLIGDVRGKSVLELGCGNGYWLRLLNELGAASCRGIDHAPSQIESAISWENASTGITFEVGNITEQIELNDQYDIVFLEHVLLEITTEDHLKKIFQNAHKALKANGKLVVSDMHPFAPSSKPENMKIPSDFNYFHDGASFEIASQRVDGETIFYKDCHWSLGALTKAITDAGFCIIHLLEPLPSTKDVHEHPEQLGYRLVTPMALMMECRPIK